MITFIFYNFTRQCLFTLEFIFTREYVYTTSERKERDFKGADVSIKQIAKISIYIQCHVQYNQRRVVKNLCVLRSVVYS